MSVEISGPSPTAPTASQILTSVKTVDGSGSGLDADLLDGQSSAAFALDASVPHLTGTETIAGAKTFSTTPIVPDASWAVLKGGTGASTVATARDNLSLLSPGSPMFDATSMRAWRAAWAGRKAAPCNVLVLGDSNAVGYYATLIEEPWVRVYAKMLAVAAGLTVNPGYVSRHSLNNYLHSWTTSGSLNEFATSGLGYAAVGPAANGGYIEITESCDRFWILYTGGTLIGKYGVQVNAGASIEVPAISGTIAGGYAWDSGALTPGSNTLRITATDTTFAPRIEGVYFFNGNGNSTGSQGTLSNANSLTGVGPRVWNGAKFGTQASHFAATSATTWWTDSLRVVNPDLVEVCFGTNEITAGTTPATMKTNIATMVARINTVMAGLTRPTPSYRFHVPHGTGANDAAFLPYRTGIIESAIDNGAAIVDRYGLTGFVGTSATDLWGITTTLDGATRVHLATKGHRLVGEYVAGHALTGAGLGVSGL